VPALQISEERATAEAARLTAGRSSLQATAVIPTSDLAGAAGLTSALRSAVVVSDSLIAVTVEATTLGALAITNAVLDAEDADR